MIYLDQAATSFPKIKEVQDAVIDCMNHCTNANRSTSVTSLNAKHLQKKTKMIIVTHSSNVTGEIYPIAEIGKLAHEHGILMMSDVAQSAGHLLIDMEKMNLDILCFSGHKGLLGNSGVGGFCLAQSIEMEPLISGGTGMDSFNHFQSDYYPEHVEAGTRNMTGIASLKAGVFYLMKYQDEKSKYTNELVELLYDGLKSIPQVVLYGDFKERTPILAFNIRGMDSFQVADLLNNKYDIAIRCGNTVKSGIVRVSLSFMNTKEEIQFFIKAIQEISEGNYDN